MAEEIKRVDPSSREVRSIEMIAALDARLANDRKYLEDRLRLVPDLFRQWRIAETAAAKVVDGLYTTLPMKTLTRMRRLYESSEIIIRPKGGMNKDSDCSVVLNADLKMIFDTARNNECAMCMKSGRDVKRCKLREAFMRVMPPNEVFDDHTFLCEYMRVWDE